MSSSSSARGSRASAPRSKRPPRPSAPRPGRAFWRVTLPVMAPGVVAAALFAFAVSFDQFVDLLFPGAAGRHDPAGRDLCGDPQGLHAGDQRHLDHHHPGLDGADAAVRAALPLRRGALRWPSVEVQSAVPQALRRRRRARRRVARFRRWRVLRPAGPERQRQDDAAARDRRLRRSRRRRDPHRRRADRRRAGASRARSAWCSRTMRCSRI